MTTSIRVADLSVDELRGLVRQAVREALGEYVAQSDPDVGLTLRADVAEYLHEFISQPATGTPLDDVIQDLGLDV